MHGRPGESGELPRATRTAGCRERAALFGEVARVGLAQYTDERLLRLVNLGMETIPSRSREP